MLNFDPKDSDNSIYWSPNEKRMLKHLCEEDGIQFMRYFFKRRENNKMLRNWHHYEIEKALQRVIDGEINRLIINIPPGYTKTELAVLNFIARGLAINPRAKFIHASYSGDLAHENSSKIRETIESQEYQELWPMQIKVDANSKKKWFTTNGGGMMAVPAGGQITGFRAGTMDTTKFTGAFIIDDPVKPDDAYSQTLRTRINNRFNNTMRSRLAVESVPMIVIMQRIHEEDMSGFLLKGGSGDMWHHLILPAHVTDEFLERPYDKDYVNGIPIKVNMSKRKGPLWGFKHSVEQLAVLESGDPNTYSVQMQQEPSPLGGGMFKDKWWKSYSILPPDIDLIRIYADTAQKTAERNDYSVFQAWAHSPTKGIFLLDQCRGKWEAPELESKMVEFWNKHKPNLHKRIGAQAVKIEDKSSGSSLIQSIKSDYFIPVEAIQRNTDKVLRAMGVVKYFASGYIHIPEDAEWVHDYKEEFRKFTPLMSHRHDDQIDPTMDAVEDLLVFRAGIYTESALS